MTRPPPWASFLLLALAAALGWVLYELRARQGELAALASAACRRDPVAVARLRSYLLAVLVVAPASTFGFAGYLAHLARRIRRDGVFPPPGTWSFARRTVSGSAARRLGLILLALAVTLALLGLLLTLLGGRMWMLLDR